MHIIITHMVSSWCTLCYQSGICDRILTRLLKPATSLAQSTLISVIFLQLHFDQVNNSWTATASCIAYQGYTTL